MREEVGRSQTSLVSDYRPGIKRIAVEIQQPVRKPPYTLDGQSVGLADINLIHMASLRVSYIPTVLLVRVITSVVGPELVAIIQMLKCGHNTAIRMRP